MLQTNERRGSRRRGTGSRSKIRRYTNLENVIVEETFSLSVPIDTPAAIRGEAGIKEEDENFAGDGYYISATVQNNRRYYGVLLDQAALKAASLLHFQDESRSLDLNRRMKVLQEQYEGYQCSSEHMNSQTEEPQVKRMKLETCDLPRYETGGIVQKFRYVKTKPDDPSGCGYRLLMATFTDIDAAAEDNVSKATKIYDACHAGGGFVDKYYYQYEVRNLFLSCTSN